MNSSSIYLLVADAILFPHILFVLFVILGLLAVFVGKFLQWQWVRNWWFRASHLAAIGFVAGQAWLGAICPLTILEMQLREKAGDAVYSGTFISHWMETLLYYQAPPWVFVVAYTLFLAVVVASWYFVRPFPRNGETATGVA